MRDRLGALRGGAHVADRDATEIEVQQVQAFAAALRSVISRDAECGIGPEGSLGERGLERGRDRHSSAQARTGDVYASPTKNGRNVRGVVEIIGGAGWRTKTVPGAT